MSPMENPARCTIALAVLAAAIIAAAVALDLSSVAAQSEDDQTGRILAQRLADGRTEFGWQPAGGARVLPRARYFPTDTQVDRWLNSSPVEVEGEAIGRINARLRSDGRIEFAFTPTDGERIEPPARYFPVDAPVGRWLRSTEITISAAPAATGFVAISAGTCAIRAGSGAIECWGGSNDAGEHDAPPGPFTAVAAGWGHTCGLRESGAIECWGSNDRPIWSAGTSEGVYVGQSDAPTGRFTAISAGGYRTCGLRESGEIECWGEIHTDSFNPDAAPPGPFTAISAGQGYACGLRTSGEIACWGAASYITHFVPPGPFTAVSAGGFYHTCGLRENGAIECWGSNEYGGTDAPAP